MAGLTDEEIVEVQLGRPVRGDIRVAHRCVLGLPVVVDVPPVLPSGEPFPTTYWLSCPLAHRRIARLEEAGGVRTMDARVASEPEFAERLEAAHARYAAERDRRVPADARHKPRGGVAGTSARGVKCLHAHYADAIVGHDNPVGAWVMENAGAMRCEFPCAVAGEAGPRKNAAWREPPA